MITLTERERIIREWNEEADNVIERTHKKRMTAANIDSIISYFEIRQYELNEEDFKDIVALDYAKEVLEAHLKEVQTDIEALEKRYLEIRDGPVMEGKGDDC